MSKNKNALWLFLGGLGGVALTLLSQHYVVQNASSALSGKREPELKITLEPRNPHSSCGEVFVWKSSLPAASDNPSGLPLHRHNYSRFLIPLTEGTLQRKEKTGETTEYELEIGKPVFLHEDTLEGFHTDENLSGVPIEVVVVQFNKQPPIRIQPLSEDDLKLGVVSEK